MLPLCSSDSNYKQIILILGSLSTNHNTQYQAYAYKEKEASVFSVHYSNELCHPSYCTVCVCSKVGDQLSLEVSSQ